MTVAHSEASRRTITTQQARVTVRLREMILGIELVPGERITEIGIAQRLGVSRTPSRRALPALALV